MSSFCVNCGSVLEADSKFCPSCGFQVEVRDSREFVEYAPVAVKSTKPVVFASSRSRRISSSHTHPRRCRPRRQHSGWVLGVIFLSLGLIFALLILAPLAMYGSFNHDGRWSDMGVSMDHMGNDMGDFFGSFGERMGDFGESIGDFFGGFGESIGDAFSSPFSDHPFRSMTFFIFPGLLFLFGFVFLALFVARSYRRPT
ncbi:MAG: zinc-ribbon domain-containing protein [Candidatus Hodarchaeales archaeon]|jgi:hypothetical protein